MMEQLSNCRLSLAASPVTCCLLLLPASDRPLTGLLLLYAPLTGLLPASSCFLLLLPAFEMSLPGVPSEGINYVT